MDDKDEKQSESNLPEPTEEVPALPSNDLVRIIQESGLPADKKSELVDYVLHYSKYHEGPLPPSEDFARYNEIVPGGGDRILSMAEKEQQMRADAQEGILSNERIKIKGAIFLGFSLIGAAIFAIWMGNTLVAISLGSIGVVTAVIRVILGFIIQKKDSNQE